MLVNKIPRNADLLPSATCASVFVESSRNFPPIALRVLAKYGRGPFWVRTYGLVPNLLVELKPPPHTQELKHPLLIYL